MMSDPLLQAIGTLTVVLGSIITILMWATILTVAVDPGVSLFCSVTP